MLYYYCFFLSLHEKKLYYNDTDTAVGVDTFC